jgi:3-deoxy-D-manno-octulosonic-acid transferase
LIEITPDWEFTLRTAYNILFLVFFVLSAPYYFWRLKRRGNWTRNFGQRFASYDPSLKQALTNRHVVWLHAVSVGEVNLCTQLIRALEIRAPNAKIVVSCTTTTGMEELRKRLPSHVSKIYYPVDRRKYVRHALATINPQVIVLIEAEIWPNFLWRAKDVKIPVFLANARLSDRSFPRYKKFGWLFRSLFESFAGVGCQNEQDAQRLQSVGCRTENIRVVGNLKFDAAKLGEQRKLDVRGILRQLGVANDAPVLVAGSTHEGEELMLVEIAARLRQKFPKLFLILVPRHFERCKDLGQRLRQHKVKFVYRNEIFARTQMKAGEVDCLLVNTTGELRFFYEPATAVFIGKSMMSTGGQNPIEPGALGKAILFGPNMQNFTDITRSFLLKDAAMQVKDPAALEAALAELLQNEARRTQLGKNALEVVAENLGAIDRTVEMILPSLAASGIKIVPKNSERHFAA